MDDQKYTDLPLPRYQSHKIVRALKIKNIIQETDASEAVIVPEDKNYGQFIVSAHYMNKHFPKPGGYYVLYADGYHSWSPADVFEEGYTRIDDEGVDFGTAITALKAGHRVARKGWNGKGMFLFLLPAADGIPTKAIHDPALRKVIEEKTGGDTFDAHGSIRMWTAENKILTGWLASQTDILATDWQILTSPNNK